MAAAGSFVNPPRNEVSGVAVATPSRREGAPMPAMEQRMIVVEQTLDSIREDMNILRAFVEDTRQKLGQHIANPSAHMFRLGSNDGEVTPVPTEQGKG